MSSLEEAVRKPTWTIALDALTDARRRRTLAVLLDRSEPLSERDLAAAVVAAERDVPADDVPADAAADALVALRHAHLPQLADAGLVTRDGRTVSASDAPVLNDPQFRRLVDADGENWEELLDCIADERRRTVLDVLEGVDGWLPRTPLANLVATRGDDAVEAVAVQLHHRHLPKLDQAGLVAYDRDADTVRYRGHPELPSMAALDA